jgi:DNA-binding NtrC family response regulator/tetratricopeptide (TPR) repeat protein
MDGFSDAPLLAYQSTAEVESCCAVLSRMAMGEAVHGDEYWESTRLAIRLMRNVDEMVADRIISLFRSACASGEPSILSRFHSLLSNRAFHKADYAISLGEALAGREIAVTAGLEREVSLNCSLAGSAAQRLGRFDEAADWFDESLVSARRAGDAAQEAGTLSNVALLAMLRGQPELAMSKLQRAMVLYESPRNAPKIARCQLNRGIFLSKLGKLDEAATDLESALAYFEDSGANAFANSARLALSRVQRTRGNYLASRVHLEQVLRATSEGFDPRKRVIALEYSGDLFMETGTLDEAVASYELAWSAAYGIGLDSDLFIECSYRLGFALVANKVEIERGLDLLRDSVARSQRLGDAYEHAASLLAYGRATQLAGNSADSEPLLRSSLAVAARIGDRFTHALSALTLSRLRMDAGEGLEAVGFATEAKTEFAALPSPRWAAEAETWLTELVAALASGSSHGSRHNAIPEVTKLKESAPAVKPLVGIPSFITADQHVRQLLTTTLKLAPRSLSMLVLGETGTGKELVAEAIHNASDRKGPFVPVNCGALPGDLLEAELFGHARGAYTGADRERGGLIEFSHRGTLFLDEIGDMPLKAQARLLRALERGEVRRLGENAPRLVDLRIVAATHRNLLEMVSAGDFRLDLYHRLTGFVITIPPLRERAGDVELLIDHFLAGFAREQDKVVQIAPEVRSRLAHQAWPGNVRQLRNVVLRLVSLSEAGQTVSRMPFELEGAESPRSLPEALDAEERRRILAALQASNWNKAKAAVALGASRTTLIGKMKRLGIEPPDSGARVR